MNIISHRLLRLLMAGIVAISGLGAAQAQTAFPNKPIHFIVPADAGGGFDQVARLVGDRLGKNWGVPVLVENRPGAGHVLATSYVAGAVPDGTTLLVAGGNHTLNPFFHAKLPYDSVADFAPVMVMARTPFVLVVHPSLDVASVDALTAYAKAHPGALNFTATQPAGAAQLSGELYKLDAGIDMQFVPFKGSTGALTDVLAGRVQVMFDAPVTSLPYIERGQLKALAVTSAHRLASLPNVPTMTESGMAGFDITAWVGLIAPKGTPQSVIDKLNAGVTEVLADPEVRAKLASTAWSVEPSTPAEMTRFMAGESQTWADLVKRAKLRTE